MTPDSGATVSATVALPAWMHCTLEGQRESAMTESKRMRKFALAMSVDAPAASVMVVGSTGVPLVLAEPMRSFAVVPVQAMMLKAEAIATRAGKRFVISVAESDAFDTRPEASLSQSHPARGNTGPREGPAADREIGVPHFPILPTTRFVAGVCC